MGVDFPVLFQTYDLHLEGLAHFLRRSQSAHFSLQPLGLLLLGRLAQHLHPGLDSHGLQEELLRDQFERPDSLGHLAR